MRRLWRLRPLAGVRGVQSVPPRHDADAETVSQSGTVIPDNLPPARWNRGTAAQHALIGLALLVCNIAGAPLAQRRALLTSVLQSNLLLSAASVAADSFRAAFATAYGAVGTRDALQHGPLFEGAELDPAFNLKNPPIGHVVRHLLELAVGAPDLVMALRDVALDAAIIASDAIEAEVIAAKAPREVAVASLKAWSGLVYRLGIGEHPDARFCVRCVRRRGTIPSRSMDADSYVYLCSTTCFTRRVSSTAGIADTSRSWTEASDATQPPAAASAEAASDTLRGGGRRGRGGRGRRGGRGARGAGRGG